MRLRIFRKRSVGITQGKAWQNPPTIFTGRFYRGIECQAYFVKEGFPSVRHELGSFWNIHNFMARRIRLLSGNIAEWVDLQNGRFKVQYLLYPEILSVLASMLLFQVTNISTGIKSKRQVKSCCD